MRPAGKPYPIVGFPDSQLTDIRRAHRIINDYTIAFFDRFLTGTSEPLVDGRTPSPYPDVTVASRNTSFCDATGVAVGAPIGNNRARSADDADANGITGAIRWSGYTERTF